MAKKTGVRSKGKKNYYIKKITYQKKIKELSLKDPLTSLYNYQYFLQRLDTEFKHAKKYAVPLSLIMIDIAYFKSINETYGYKIGNNILKEFAHFLSKFARTGDTFIRCGGAKFAILSLNTNKGGAIALAKRLCERIQKHSFRAYKYKIKLRLNIGIANFPEDEVNTPNQLIFAADEARRESSELGGNKVCTYGIKIRKLKPSRIKLPASRKEDIENLKRKLRQAGKKLDQALLDSIYAFAKAIEAKNHYTGEHAEEMVNIVNRIGKELKLSKKEIVNLEHAAVLHDLGKIGIDDKILRKRGKLTKEEYEEIKKHPIIGAEIIRSIHFLREVVPLILYHHERFDGKGYTSGLKGNEIPLGARILAIADVYQALTSDRPYRRAYTKKEAIKIIKEASGTQFDPEVVDAFLKIESKKQKIKS